MKSHSYIYSSENSLREFCVSNTINDSRSLLIQVFTGIVTLESIQELQSILTDIFPKAAVIGCTSDGAIAEGKLVAIKEIVMIFTQFNNTHLRTNLLQHDSSRFFETGARLARSIISNQTKAIITFSDGLKTNGEEYIKGLGSVNPGIPIAGGMASDNAQLIETFVFNKDKITNNGAVAVSLDSPHLVTHGFYSFNWQPIGKKMLVSKAVKNRVYEIDRQPAKDIYSKYLGFEVGRRLLIKGIEFPLTLERNGVTIGRAVIGSEPDGSLIFAGNISEGEFVRFGIGNVDTILRDSREGLLQLHKKPVESIFVYSCTGRKHFIGDPIQDEVIPLEQIAPTAGFFTNGEYFHSQCNSQFLNQTMTVLALSESHETKSTEYLNQDTHNEAIHSRSDALLALGNLANTVTHELEALNTALENRVIEKTEQILKQIYTDGLTGIPNRNKMLEEIEKTKQGHIILINIDDFTSINDFFGHTVGDYVLKTITHLLQQKILDNPSVSLFKLPADEFAIIHSDVLSEIMLNTWMEDIGLLLHTSAFSYGGQALNVSVTLGAARIGYGTIGLAHADMALKHAKKIKTPHLLYDKSMHLSENVEENIKLANIVRTAVSERKVIPYFQPIFDLKSGKIVKYECLARLIQEDGCVLGPNQFLPVAQKIRIYPQVTRLMLESALTCLKKEHVDLSINISIDDILNAETCLYILSLMNKSEAWSNITFEITETQQLEDNEEVINFIREIQSLGGKIAIDDFGSGYANFFYMTRISADDIKIDGSLIKNIDRDENARLVVETIVSFARKLNIKTIAEFIHSPEVLQTVREIGIDYGQGFHLGKPAEHIFPDKHAAAVRSLEN